MKEIKDNVFNEEVMNAEMPVVVDFWAPWCGPCRMVGPVMEELSQDYEGKVKFVKVNVDENHQSSETYGIASIPTIMIFKNGEIAEKLVGFKPKASFEEIINKHL